MRNVVLYIAMSLDGYIADDNGGVSWLGGDGSDTDNQGSYSEFIKSIDIVILGYKTYHQIVTELSPGAWVYAGKKSYVMTHRRQQNSDEIAFTDKNLPDLISNLKMENGKDIWICGGSTIINQLLDFDLIDRFCISVMPIILGRGVPLFSNRRSALQLKLISTQSYNGMTDLIYERRESLKN